MDKTKLSIRSRALINLLKQENLNPEKNRDIIKLLKLVGRFGFYKVPVGFEILREQVDGVPIEIFKKRGTEPQTLVYVIHGGAFILPLTTFYKMFNKVYYKAGKGAAVANIDYRTAPENVYPAAHDDVFKGWNHLVQKGYEPKNIIVVGDSAGGNLALSLLLKLRDLGLPMPRAAVVMSPWADLSSSTHSYKANYSEDSIFGNKKGQFTPEKMEILQKSQIYAYCGDADRCDPYLSPMFGEYHDLPPIFISVGSTELLCDEALAIAKKIEQAGGQVDIDVGEGMFHVYPLFYHLLPEAKSTFSKIVRFIGEKAST